jgi:small subunit ribosomal protein S21
VHAEAVGGSRRSMGQAGYGRLFGLPDLASTATTANVQSSSHGLAPQARNRLESGERLPPGPVARIIPRAWGHPRAPALTGHPAGRPSNPRPIGAEPVKTTIYASRHYRPSLCNLRKWGQPGLGAVTSEEGGKVVKLMVRDRESIQEAVRRFRKLVERSGIKKEMRRREYYEKPSEVKRRARLRAERRARRTRLLQGA